MRAALAAALAVLTLMSVAAPAASAHPGAGSAFYSGVITGPGFCVDLSLGGPVTYPFDSNGDGVADVCALPRTRRAAVARQLAMERLAAELPERFRALLATECAAAPAVDGGQADPDCLTDNPVPPPPEAEADRRFYSGVISGPGFCFDLSLGGPVTYPFDSDGDGVADVCALPRTRSAAVAWQLAMERLAVEFSVWFKSLLGAECAAVAETFGNPEAEAQDECQPHRSRPPEGARAITAETPLRVYTAGDSQSQFLGSWLNSDSRLDVTVDALHSTGLARSDVYDWPSRFSDVLAEQDPELVVLVMGANDTQALFAADGTAVVSYLGSGWHQEWSRRLNSVLDQFAAPHRHLVWVGQPPTLPDHFRQGYAVLNRLAAEVIAARSDSSFLDIWELFGGDGPYQADVVPPGGGTPVTARQSDGVHLSFAGARWVADLVLEIAQGRWEFEGSG